VPRYQQAQPFDFIRSVKNLQRAVQTLQVQSPALTKKSLNQISTALNANPYFWGGDSTGWIASNGTLNIASDPPASSPYPYAALFVITASGVGAALNESSLPFAVVPTQQYLITAQINTPSASVTFGVDWLDSTHAFISTSTQSITVSPNTWTQITTAVTAPSGAAFAYPRIAPTDGVGNYIYAEAITAQLTTAAYQPASNPLTVETWHSVTLPSSGGFSGTIRVKLAPFPGFGILDVQVRWTGTTGTTYSAGSLPSAAYYPTTGTTRFYNISYGGAPNSDSLGSVNIPSSGAIQIFTAPSSGGSGTAGWYGGTIIYPLD
jgi:hypothetical protein